MCCITPIRTVRETKSGNIIVTVAVCMVRLFCVNKLNVELLDGFRLINPIKMPAKLSSNWNSDPVSLHIRNHNVVSVTRINLNKTSVIKMLSLTLKVVKPVFPMRR